MKEQHELLVVKDNELIENFIFNATELELQILNYAVAVTNPYWEAKDHIYRISIPELVATYKTKSKNAYKVYREALERLQIRTYRYHNGVKEVTENVLRKIMRDTTDNSYLEICFNDYIATRLNNLKGLFTQYDIKNISKFSSRYAFIFYEFFKMKLDKSVEVSYLHQTSVNALKDNLSIQGKYLVFAELKRNVIDRAKTQINKHSDINLDYQVIKTGRTPTHIKFIAKYKKKAQAKEIEAKKAKPVEHQTQLLIGNTVKESSPGFTEHHKTTAKKHLDNLKRKTGIKT